MAFIYQIKNLKNNKIYIGSSKNYEKRKYQHKYELNNEIHKNTHLQNAWKKYGEDAFEFSILEECEDLKQFEREQYYLNKLNPFDENGYNVVRRINKDLICLNTIKLKCSRCKKEFESTSKLRKYCDACSKIIKEASRDEWIKCGCGMRYLSASKETEGMWEAIGSPESEEAFYDWC